MNERLHCEAQIIKLLEENVGSKLSDIALSNIFLMDLLRQGKQTATKKHKWDCTKLKNICTTKETPNKTKR